MSEAKKSDDDLQLEKLKRETHELLVQSQSIVDRMKELSKTIAKMQRKKSEKKKNE